MTLFGAANSTDPPSRHTKIINISIIIQRSEPHHPSDQSSSSTFAVQTVRPANEKSVCSSARWKVFALIGDLVWTAGQDYAASRSNVEKCVNGATLATHSHEIIRQCNPSQT